jgi:RNA polymerase sigma-70 factor (ECF subfamily)
MNLAVACCHSARAGRAAEDEGVLLHPEDMAELAARVAQHRDREAFARLFDHFAPRLNGYLQRLGADASTAEEITQDVMSTLWRKAALFDPAKSSLSTWLYRVARNRRIDGLRRDRADALEPSEPMLQPAAAPDPLDQLDAGRREEAIRLALEGLPEEQLGLVRLAFFEAMSHSEIAARTGLPLGTVKSRLRLAFTRLRRTLEASGIVDAG